MILSVYIHIPFCSYKCDFCDFAAFAGMNHLENDYCQIVCREIEGRLGQLEEKPTISSVFYGGGTPGLIDPALLGKIQCKLLQYVDLANDAEITLETTPQAISKSKVADWLAMGVNRLSIGVQSFDDAELKAIGRDHTSKQAIDGITAAMQAGFTNINCDLMYGLPTQTMSSWEESISKLLHLATDLGHLQHISAYSLTFGQNSHLLQRFPKNSRWYPDDDQHRQMYELLVLSLKESNFEQYEISNFSKPHAQSKHNLTYWQNFEYEGLGVSSHRHVGGVRSSNWQSLKRYMRDCLGYQDREVIDSKTQMKEAIMLGLRLRSGINLAGFENRYGVNLLDTFKAQIKRLESGGFIEICDAHLRLTAKAVLVSNAVISEFF
jgi:oxygen-independent coproporphyrinogen-3 oxidase